jgi:hypothetical protein
LAARGPGRRGVGGRKPPPDKLAIIFKGGRNPRSGGDFFAWGATRGDGFLVIFT